MKNYNIIIEPSYQFGFANIFNSKGRLKKYSLKAGPVIYFNSCVGLELLLGYKYNYEKTNDFNSIYTTKGFYTTIGFQIHLEKNKK